MRITFEIPDDLASLLPAAGQDLSRAALEAIGIEAYRQGRLSGYQLRMLLDIPSRYELDGFLKQHQVYDYTLQDFEEDLETIRKTRQKQPADKSA